MEIQNTKKAININKPAYILFVLASLLFFLFRNIDQSAIFMLLALAFDPFDLTTPFNQRPFYQQAWLFVHVLIALALFILMVFM